MTTVEAGNDLVLLLDRLEEGETITTTRGGVPTAMLVPIAEVSAAAHTPPTMTHEEIVAAMCELRKRVKPDTMSIKDMINEGRRY